VSELFEPFRGKLRKELPRWRAEGLIDERAERALVERYRLDESGVGAGTMAIYVLGGLLLCGGVLSFVAWNWESMSRAAKLLLLAGATGGAQVAGWLLRTGNRLPRLGHALTLLGTLLVGADIGLVAQLFHVPSVDQAGFGLWAIGALVAAWAYRSPLHGAVAAVVGCIWAAPEQAAYAPWLLAASLLPLALLEGSRLLFALASVATVVAASTAAASLGGGRALYATQFAGAALLLAWPLLGRAERLHGLSRVLGILALLAAAFPLTFHEFADHALRGRGTSPLWLLVAAPAAAGALLSVARGAARLRAMPVTLAALAAAALAALPLVATSEILQAAAANAALVLLAGAAIWVSMRDLRRGSFWFGSLLAGALIASRFFEFDTGLGTKAAVFIACGVAVLLVGFAFERRLKGGA